MLQREAKIGKLNAVSLQVIHSNGVVTEEKAIENIKRVIDNSRRELLRLVLQEKGSIVPKACKELIWKMSKVLQLFYMNAEGFTSNVEMLMSISEVIFDPIVDK